MNQLSVHLPIINLLLLSALQLCCFSLVALRLSVLIYSCESPRESPILHLFALSQLSDKKELMYFLKSFWLIYFHVYEVLTKYSQCSIGSSKSMGNLYYRVKLSTKRLRTFLLKKSKQQNSDGSMRLCD